MNRTPDLITALRAEIHSAPSTELPAIIGQVEALKAEAFARLVAPPQPTAGEESQDDGEDRLLTVAEAAQKLGHKAQWIRVHQHELPRVKLPGRGVRFSERKLDAWLARRTT